MSKKFIHREAIIVIVGQGGVALAGLLSVRILTEIYPSGEYGLAWLFIGGVMFAAQMITGLFVQISRRFYHGEHGTLTLDSLLGFIWRYQTGLILVAVIFYVPFALKYGIKRYPEHKFILAVLPVYFVFLSFMLTAQDLFNTARQRGRRVTIQLGDAWTRPLLALLIGVLFGTVSRSFVFGFFLSTTSFAIISLYWMFSFGSKLPWKLEPPSVLQTMELFKYGLPWIAFALTGWVLSLSDRYIIGYLIGPAFAGVYIASYQIGSSIFQLLSGIYGPLFQPIIFQKAAEGDGVSSNYLSLILEIYLWISIPLLGLFILCYRFLMVILVSKAFLNGMGVVLWIGLGTYFLSLGNLFQNFFLIKKQTVPVVIIFSIVAVINITLNIILIPKFGIIAAGWSTFVAYFLYAFMMYVIGSRILKPQINGKIVAMLILSGGLALAVSKQAEFTIKLNLETLPGVAIVSLLYIAAFLMCIALTRKIWSASIPRYRELFYE